MRINFSNFNYQRKTSGQNFKGREDVRLQAAGFADDIIEITKGRNSIPKWTIEQVVKGYLPTIVIRHGKDAKGSNIFCNPHFRFTYANPVCHLQSQTLHIPKIVQNPRFSQKVDFVDYIVHEMTHAFQNADTETSFITRFNNYLKSNSLEKLKDVTAVSRVLFDFMETKVVYPMMDDLYVKAIDKDLTNISTPKELLDRVLPNVTDEFEAVVSEKLIPFKNKLSNADMEFVLTDIKETLLEEEDAYRAGVNASKKFQHKKEITADDAIPELYKSFSSVTNKYF